MRTAAQAVAWAKQESKRPTANRYGLCLAFVKTALAANAAGAASAIIAWNMTPAAHRETGSSRPAPGKPVYWRGGKHGHVALSAGGGKCWSTDIRRRGKVDLVPISEITRKWGYAYLGATKTYVGQSIPGVGGSAPKLPSDPNAYPGAGAFKIGQSHPSVTRLDKRLIKHGYTKHKAGATYTPGPTFTKYTKANVAEFQRAQGWTGKDADGYPGRETWKRLFSPPKAKKPAPPPKPADPIIKFDAAKRSQYGYSATSYKQSQLSSDKSWRTRDVQQNLRELERDLDILLERLER